MFRTSATAAAAHSRWPIVGATALTLALVLAGPGGPVAQAQDGAADSQRSISVSGFGQAEVEPDEALIQLGVTASAATAQGATGKAATAMEAVIASLQDSGVDEGDIKTTRLELRQIRQRDRETRNVTVRWQVRNRVSATIKDLDATGETIDAAIAAGATNLDRLQFRATDPSAALAKAREEAVAAAALTASQLASASGVEVAGVLSIVEGGGDLDTLRLRDSAAGFSAQRQSASTPIQPGTIDIAVTVFVEYLIS